MSAVLDFPIKPEARPYLDAARGVADEPEWLAQHRRRALARFAEQGFPSRRGEAWRYLDLRPLEQSPLLPATARRASMENAAPLISLGLAAPATRLVLVDGFFSPELSGLGALPAGISLYPTGRAIETRPDLVDIAVEALAQERDQPFAALNTACFTDGFVLDVAPGAVLQAPIEIVHLASGQTPVSLHTRSLVKLGAKSRARLIETYAGAGRYWRNDVVVLRLAADAALDRVALVEEAEEATHFAVFDAELASSARLTSFALLLGGGTIRHEAVVRSDGESASCSLYGAFLAAHRQQANIVTSVDHRAERGATREIFKGVAAGRAHGAFQGRITVRPGAQKVDAHMLSRNLLLGPHAAIDTKPELEIFADDVKCSHGAAVGDLDETVLFYLLARGIPRDEARRMLIAAFLREAVDVVDDPVVREHLLNRLGRRLAALEE